MFNFWPLLFLAALSWVSARGPGKGWPGAGKGHKRCDELQPVTPNFSLIVANSPYHAMWSSQSIYNCTTGIMTGPAPVYGNNFTWILVRDYDMLASFSVTADMSNETLYSTCAAGQRREVKFLAFDPSYYIVYSCTKSGSALSVVRGYGHSANDSAQIKNITDTYLKGVRGAKDLYNSNNGCPFKPWCGGYFGLY